MTTIGGQGLVDDGSGNLTVTGLTLTAATAMLANNSVGSGSVALGTGFFQVPVTGSGGASQFTGTLPSPSAFPGGTILVTDTLGIYPYLLTGTMAMNSSSVAAGSVVTTGTQKGTKLSVSQGGTVGLWSDTKGWLVIAVSGSCTLNT